MNHDVGADHEEDGVAAQTARSADPEAAKEYFQGEELTHVDGLPNRKIEPGSTGQAVHGVVGPEITHVGDKTQGGNHHGQAQKIDPRVFKEAAHTQTEIKRILLEHQRPDRQRQQVGEVAR